jgi:hypothetical protein
MTPVRWLLLNLALTAINLAVALWRAERGRRPPAAHPLEPSLRDLAQAIRETGGQT